MFIDILFIHKLIMFAVVLTPLVGFHELGHLLFARKFGVGVKEFAIGFGPKIFGFKDSKNTKWQFNSLPFGGYIEVLEEDSATCDKNEVQGHTLSSRSYSEKMWTYFGGPLANFILAFIVVWGTVIFFGISEKTNVIGNMKYDYQGINIGDEIVSVDGKITNTWRDVSLALSGKSEANFSVKKLSQDNMSKNVELVNIKAKENKGLIKNTYEWGFEAKETDKKFFNIVESLIEAGKFVYKNIVEFLTLLGIIFTSGLSVLSGPVGIFKAVGTSSSLESLLWLGAKLSMSLGLFNLLPLPMLDGGQMLVATIEKIKGKKLSNFSAAVWSYSGLILIIGLFGFLTIMDLFK